MDSDSVAADRLIAEGNRAESSGKLREAYALYRQAVSSAPHYAKAHLNLAIALEATAAHFGWVAPPDLSIAEWTAAGVILAASIWLIVVRLRAARVD